jgi:hypothetical protein
MATRSSRRSRRRFLQLTSAGSMISLGIPRAAAANKTIVLDV